MLRDYQLTYLLRDRLGSKQKNEPGLASSTGAREVRATDKSKKSKSNKTAKHELERTIKKEGEWGAE